MTRRERMEARLERRREWAEKRAEKAAALRAVNQSMRVDHAFCMQPGIIPARTRMNRRDEKAWEHDKMAAHHKSKAAGTASALDNSIFSDDPDAIEALEAKIVKLEAERARYAAANKIVRRKPKNEATPEKLAELAELLGCKEATAAKLFEPDFCGRIGFAPYIGSNLTGNIGRLRKRIEEVKQRQERTAIAEANGGVSIVGADFIAVTFDEKPERAILDALKAAAFVYSGGSWCGYRAALPEEVKALAEEVTR